MLRIAREGAAHPLRPGFKLGVDGRGWIARAEAEWKRAAGENDPAAWRRVVEVFGPGFIYETARSRWRLAEALAEAGDREAARIEWLLAAEVAAELSAAPLQRALADLGRRARLGMPGSGNGQPGSPGQAGAGGRGPLAGLTGREL